MERRLGRGLGSLLKDPKPDDSPTEIELARIRPNPFQPRKTFDAASLQELRASIELHGVLQPVVVRPVADHYELILGERRWRAARLAGRKAVPAIVRPQVSDGEMLELALVENVQRRDLDPIERAKGFHQLMARLELTQDQVAQKVGLKRSTVTNHLRLLDLPDEVQEALGQGLVSMGHARALLGMRDTGAQRSLLEEIVRRDLSVRAVERRVRDAGERGPQPVRATATPVRKAPWIGEVEDRLREHLGTKVELRNGPDYRGQIVIQYADRKALDRLIDLLAPARTL